MNDQAWLEGDFIPTVQKRGAAIIEARGSSSAASAANAAIDHMRDWALGTNGKWVTMGIPSDGQYGIPKDTMFGFAVTCEGGEYKLVEGLEIDAFGGAPGVQSARFGGEKVELSQVTMTVNANVDKPEHVEDPFLGRGSAHDDVCKQPEHDAGYR